VNDQTHKLQAWSCYGSTPAESLALFEAARGWPIPAPETATISAIHCLPVRYTPTSLATHIVETS
jgi:hypothetical protein